MPVTTRLQHLNFHATPPDHSTEQIQGGIQSIERIAIMKSHNNCTAMDIDSPIKITASSRSDSPSKSDSGNSDDSTFSYTDDFATLQSSGATSYAHILDLGEYAAIKEDAFKLQDAIVATLFQLSLETLKPFLSPTVHTFKAVWQKGRSAGHLAQGTRGLCRFYYFRY